jgi:hypothetical protein
MAWDLLSFPGPPARVRRGACRLKNEESIMAHKKQRRAPVPKGNRPRGPFEESLKDTGEEQKTAAEPVTGTGFPEQDAKKRLGNYGGAGEHPYVQPGGRNQGNR